MRKSRTQKRTVVKDAQGKHVHLERLDDTPETLQPDALQQHLHLLLQRYCAKEEEEGEKEEEKRKKKWWADLICWLSCSPSLLALPPMLHKPPIHKKPMKSCKLISTTTLTPRWPLTTLNLYRPARLPLLKTLDCVLVSILVFPFCGNSYYFWGLLTCFQFFFAHFVTKDGTPFLVGWLRIFFLSLSFCLVLLVFGCCGTIKKQHKKMQRMKTATGNVWRGCTSHICLM